MPERLGDVDDRPDERCAGDELLGRLDRLLALVAVEAEHEAALEIRDVAGHLAQAVDDQGHLGQPLDVAGAGFFGVAGPRLDADADELAARVTNPLQSGLALERRERGLDHRRAAALRRNPLQFLQHRVPADRQIRVVEGDPHPGVVLRQERQIGLQPMGRQRPVLGAPVDAEVAMVRAAGAGQQRHRRREVGLPPPERRPLDLRPTLLDGRQIRQAAAAADLAPAIEGAGQDVGNQFLVALLDHQIEKPLTVFRKRAGMGAADDGQGTLLVISLGQGIGQGADMGEAGDEHHIELVGQSVERVALPVVGRVVRLVAHLAAPDGDGLGHDRGVLLVQQSAVRNLQPMRRRHRQQIENPNLHRGPLDRRGQLVTAAGAVVGGGRGGRPMRRACRLTP